MDSLECAFLKMKGKVDYAPYVTVQVSSVDGKQKGGTCLCRLDTGADISSMPRSVTGDIPLPLSKRLLLCDFDGNTIRMKPRQMRLSIMDGEDVFFDVTPRRGVLLRKEKDYGILSMDVLSGLELWMKNGKFTLTKGEHDG